MSTTINLTAQKRGVSGRKVKKLRRNGIVPANIFGKHISSAAIQVNRKDFINALESAGETNVINLTVTGEKDVRPVLVADTHQDPVTDDILHVSFRQVDLTEKVTATVPVEIRGESPAVKEKGGVLVQAINELEVEALPTNLPDKIEIDVSDLVNIGDAKHIKDLKVDRSKVTLTLEPEETVVIIQEPEAEEAPPAPVEAAPEEAAEKTEGEAPERDKEEPSPEAESKGDKDKQKQKE